MKHFTLITGASSGIGKEFAYFYAQKGQNLLLVARRTELLEEIKTDLEKKYAVQVQYLSADVSKIEDIHRVVAYTQEHQIFIDFLINNAGVALPGAIGDLVEEEIINIMDVNMKAAVLLSNAFVPQMKEKKCGKIINVASLAAFFSHANNSLYFASKAFLLNFSKSLHDECAPYNIQVSAVCPGFTQTAILTKFGDNLGHLATTQEVVAYADDLIQHNTIYGVQGRQNKFKAFLGTILPHEWIMKILTKNDAK